MTLLARVRDDERGLGLVELIAALAIGSMVLTAVMIVFTTGLTGSYKTTDRVEATQRARMAMDRVVTLLNSQQCLLPRSGAAASPPISDGRNTQVTFFANLGDVSADPVQYRLRYDAPTQTLHEDRWTGTTDALGDLVFAAQPTSTRVLATDIAVAAGAPVFTYQRFVTTGAAAGTLDPVLLPTPLTAATRFDAVRVNVAFAGQPLRTGAADPRSTSAEGAATVGSARSDVPLRGVNC